MKRTNLMVDVSLLEEATKLTGESSWSGTVNRALQELVRRIRARRIFDLRGSGLWEGNLSTMRGDRRDNRKRRSR